MKNNQEQITRLRNAVEMVVGRKIAHPKDFDYLCKQVEGYTGERISISTLKRVWGYVSSESETSQYSLGILSRMVGYDGWESFCQNVNKGECSHRVVCRKLFTSSLAQGDQVCIVWKPERKIVARFEGQDLFIILESINSKLAAGDLFHCLQFVERQPLFLSGLYRQGMPPCDYICGKQGGIIWNLIEQEEVR